MANFYLMRLDDPGEANLTGLGTGASPFMLESGGMGDSDYDIVTARVTNLYAWYGLPAPDFVELGEPILPGTPLVPQGVRVGVWVGV